ncbi:hypothetical protein [Mesorhizobium sp. Z1-4]|uniref:hypothetical protein n=1 Tax=Mesorhizobium sp. Z1-4 TaxID=2448478 RepID=UPI000FDA1C59|nr:hypothetical protein [Mesorhizobium sp. Z1-4]
MPDKIAQERWDDLVVGTSPLMLMLAQLLAVEGRRVLIVDRDAVRGGAWQTAIIKDDSKRSDVATEIACHVIEAFPGVYECLEAAAGVPFETLREQPMRVGRNGRLLPYFNRPLLLLAALRMTAGVAVHGLKTVLGRRSARNEYLNNRIKLANLLRFQIGYLRGCPKMRGPRFGYVDFLTRLYERAIRAGADFERREVTAIHRDGNRWRVTDSERRTLLVSAVHATTSVGLRPDQAGTGWVAAKARPDLRLAVVVELAEADILTHQCYVGIWRRWPLRRVSRVDTMPPVDKSEAGIKRFLVELQFERRANKRELNSALEEALDLTAIRRPGAPFRQIGAVECVAMQNIDLLPEGELADGVITYHTSGNLAAGIANWLRNRAPRSPRWLPPDMPLAESSLATPEDVDGPANHLV